MNRLLLVVAVVAAFLSTSPNPAAAQSPITVVSPYAGESVGQSPYYIRWTASPIAGNALFFVRYLDGAGEMRTICTAPASGRECLWNEPDWFATTLFIDARNSSGVTLATVQSGAFAVSAENLPPQFLSHVDVGKVGRSGAAWGHGPDAVSVGGAGADIWGTADAFHFDYTPFYSPAFDSSFTITEVDGAQPWTKVGVMVRDNASPGAPHHSLFVTRANGVAYQRRLTQNGPSLHTSVSASSTVPVQVMVMRRGSAVVMDMRQGTGAWQRVAEFRADSTMLGMAVTSHDATRIATGSFTDISASYTDPTVQILSPAGGSISAGTPYTVSWTHEQPVNTATVSYTVDAGQTWTVIPGCASITATTCRWSNPGPVTESASIRVVIDDPNDRTAWNTSDYFAIRTLTEGALPAGWVSGDVGAVSAAGSASYEAAGGRFAITGSGADIWGTADEFYYASRTVYDDGEFGTDITARVASIESVNAWTKVGLMLRAHRGAGAAQLSLFVTPTTAKGIALQRRPIENATSLHTPGPSVTGPVWLKFVVKNGHARAYYRKAATEPWTFIAEQSVALAPPYEAGLAVSSHVDGTLAHATFDNVSITPRDFSDADVGATGIAGATGTNDITRTLWGSGADIWGMADVFRFHYRPMDTTGVVSARVTSLQPTDPWAKAGVMIRQDLTPGSAHVMLIASPGKGIAMQYRATTNGPTANVAIVPGAAPVWLRLTRLGGSALGEASSDGVTWREIGRIDIALGTYITAGLAVTSHRTDRTARADFEDVVVQP